MSICRWSDDGFQCDLYVYESCGGFVVCVSSRRRPSRVCDIDITTPESFAQSQDRRRKQLESPDNQPIPIGGPHDGDIFNVETLEELLELIHELRLKAYKVPEYVIKSINAEINENNT